MANEFERFISVAQGLRGDFFDGRRTITLARAPGWVDLLGGAAGYGGALALGWPGGNSSFVALQTDPKPLLRLRVGANEQTLPLDALVDSEGAPREYAAIAARVAAESPPDAPWWPLALGAWAALMREEFVRFPGGARLLLRPAEGPGAPASWVAATAQALVSAYDVRIAPRELALACQTAARRVAEREQSALGALVSVLAPANSLLLLHPQPAWHWGNVQLPPSVAIWSVCVGDQPRSAAGGLIARGAAAMAYRLAADASGLVPVEADARWQSYLANLGSAHFERGLRTMLPDSLTGAEFVARYGAPPGGPPIGPAVSYPVRAAAALAIDEHLRSRTAVALLRAAASKAQRDESLQLVGELVTQSHWAQKAAGLSDPDADQLVERISAAGPAQGLFGARAPAAETNATVVVLGRSDAEPALRAIVEGYAATSEQHTTLFSGSAPGCNPAGTREL